MLLTVVETHAEGKEGLARSLAIALLSDYALGSVRLCSSAAPDPPV